MSLIFCSKLITISSYLNPRLVSVKLHPLRFKAGETGRHECAWRLCAPSNKRKGEASGEEGKDGEEAKGEGGETQEDGSLWFSRLGPRIPLSPLRGEDGCRFWEQFLKSGGVMEKESQWWLPTQGSGLTSSSPGERYLMSAPSTWNRKARNWKNHSTGWYVALLKQHFTSYEPSLFLA